MEFSNHESSVRYYYQPHTKSQSHVTVLTRESHSDDRETQDTSPKSGAGELDLLWNHELPAGRKEAINP
jgi:hypothetical protein